MPTATLSVILLTFALLSCVNVHAAKPTPVKANIAAAVIAANLFLNFIKKPPETSVQLAIPMEDPIVLRRYIAVTLPFYRYNNSIDVSAGYFKNGFCYIMR